MDSHNGRVELDLSPDPRFLAGLSGAVEHFAEGLGFDPAVCKDLMAAAVEACRDTFRLLPPEHSSVRVLIETFSDRLEVVLEHRGEALPTAGLDTFLGLGAEAAPAGELTGLSLLSRVDRVLYQTEGGASRMTLVKYLPKAKP